LPLFRFDFAAMASPCALQLYGADETMARLAAQAAEEEVARIERKYSRYRDDSELGRINAVAAAGGEVVVDSETAGLLDFAVEAYRKSGGLFDITSGLLRRAWDFNSSRTPESSALAALLQRVGLNRLHWSAPVLRFDQPGMELDFGGIGKEYAADRAGEIIADHGFDHALIDLGGDMVALGPNADGSPWRIGIRHPRHPDGLMATVPLRAGALASSGDYERFIEVGGRRYCHILDPRTGWPCQGLAGVTVLAGRCLVAGCVATTAMLKGRDAIAYLAASGLPHLVMDSLGAAGGNAETL
jgi:FAD:protein FMN transferase